MNAKKRHTYVSMLLLAAFVFCTAGGCSVNTMFVSRSLAQVTSHKLFSFAEFSVYDELEDDDTELSDSEATTHFPDAINFGRTRINFCPVQLLFSHPVCSYRDVPVFLALRVLRI